MNFIICLALTALLAIRGREWVRTHDSLLYGICAVLAALAAVGTMLHLGDFLPYALERLLWHPISSGSLATALWVIVMYTGAMSPKSAARKALMPIRGQLSILAGFLTLGHNIAAGQTHFYQLLTAPETMLPSHRAAAICSIGMLMILLPLWVSSFPGLRRKMKPKAWKKLQRLAYGFYALIYVHVMLLYLPMAKAGKPFAILNVIVYSIVFLGYAGLRLRLALGGKNWPLAAASAAALLVILISLPAGNLPDSGSPAAPADTVTSAAKNSAVPETAAPAEDTGRKYIDGTYEGKATGYVGTIRVRVTVEADQITKITVYDHDEDSPYWERALKVRDAILEQQTTEVDTVVSATKSSKGIRKAVADALSKAEA